MNVMKYTVNVMNVTVSVGVVVVKVVMSVIVNDFKKYFFNMYTHVEKEMSNNIEVIMSLRNKNEDEVTYPESEPCDECGVNNVSDLSFNLFCCHLEEHRSSEDRDEETSRRPGEYPRPNELQK